MKAHTKIISMLMFAVTCSFANWTGSISEPENMTRIDGKAFYVITSADELAWFAAQVNSGNGNSQINAILANDIVFGKDKQTKGTVNWIPIGSDRIEFNGVLDGAGHTIYGLFLSTGIGNTVKGCDDRSNCTAGLVGALGSNGVVKNVIMDKGEINITLSLKNRALWVGGIAGIGRGLIQNSKNQNKIYVFDSLGGNSIYVGGIVGSGSGTITNSNNGGRIDVKGKHSTQSHYSYSGGIAGQNNGEIQNCINSGTVWSTDTIQITSSTTGTISGGAILVSGGITGENWVKGNIFNSHNEGWVSSRAYVDVENLGGGETFSKAITYSGGIAGINRSKIFKCYNKFMDHGNYYDEDNIRSISTSFAESGKADPPSVPGTASSKTISYSYSGGIGGYNEGSISNCYSDNSGVSSATGNAAYVLSDNLLTTAENDIQAFEGGIVGQNANEGSTKSSYSKTEYWLNNTVVTGSVENMQKNQFAWMLNTCNGTEVNNGVWTRGTEGYPIFANEDSLPIYKITFNDDGIKTNRYTNYRGLVSFPDDPETAEGIVFTGWFNSEDVKVNASSIFSADETINAVYVDASELYWTIRFFNSDANQTLLESSQYQHGSIVTYGGEAPARESTAQYTYTFKGWDVEPTNAVENFDYHAIYDSTIRSYTITFNNYDGAEIERVSFEYGEIPSCSQNPTRAATAEWTYTHKGWTPALDYVTDATSYTATYDSTKVKYKVTFMNGTTIIDEQMVPYGSAAIAPSEVTREGYRFIGWSTTFSNVTNNLTVKALFEEIVYRTIVIITEEGTSTSKVEEKSEYELPVAPQKTGYIFDGWYDNEGWFIGYSGDKITVIENLTLEAKYTVIYYAIVFADEDGTEISSAQVAYGILPTAPDAPTKASTAQYTYTFAGWDKEITKVTGVTTYTATYNKSIRKYIVTFYDHDGSILDEQFVSYGSSAEKPVDPNRSGHKFVGWDVDYSTIVKKTDVTALYEKLSSSSSAYSSSSDTAKSSNSGDKNTDAFIAGSIPTFYISAVGYSIQIGKAKVGSAYAIFDMQGRVLKKGRVESVNYIVPMAMAGNYLVRVGNQTQQITIK